MLEIAGLFFVLLAGNHSEVVNSWGDILALPDAAGFTTIALGGFLAFYAFVGFEDMVNVVEEVKNPRKNVPIAIALAVILSTLVYIAVTLIAVRTMPIDQLATSDAPLADIVINGGHSPEGIGLISLITVINGALVQLIMASRVMYGMGNQNMAPKILSYINPTTQTPLIATILAAIFILVFALWLPLVTLAKLTSFIMLTIFTLVNIALIIIKHRQPISEGVVHYPIFVPIIGALLCVALVVVQVIFV